MDNKEIKPIIRNIIKNIKKKDNNIIISGISLNKVKNLNKWDFNHFTAKLNNKFYKINFKLKNGIKFIKGYIINKYEIIIPINEILEFDIQNKIIVYYENKYIGRMAYSLFKWPKNVNSKIIFQSDRAIYLRKPAFNNVWLTIRDINYYDSFEGKFKLEIGYILSKFCFKNNIICLYEKHCSRYEESASVLYEKLIDKGYNNAFYIINKDNIKLESINPKYKKNIIYKNSLKHIIYFFKSNTFIGTESLAHVIQLRIASRKVLNKLQSKKIKHVFLQHGVTYMVSLNSSLRSAFRKKDYAMHKIVVSSKKETKHFIEVGGFNENDLYICGFPKFDRAIKKPDADKIVIMFTWRRWEVNLAFKDFEETKYYKMIKRVFDAVPEKLKDKVIILPHPLMLDAFKHSETFKNYLSKNLVYDDILKECKVLITDYSSISYDAFYRGSNVIFYWEEKDECMKKYGEGTRLLLTDKEAFGDICYNVNDFKNVIEKNYYEDQNEEYKRRYKTIVEFDDNKNTERVIKCLEKDGVI